MTFPFVTDPLFLLGVYSVNYGAYLVMRSVLVSLIVLLMSGCGIPTKVEFPYSDGAGLPDEETGRLTWDWRGVNVRLYVDQKLVLSSNNPPDLGPDREAGFIRLLPGIHTVHYYAYRRTHIELEETFVVEAEHQYKIRSDVCWWANPRWGAAWIEDLETKKIVAGKATDCLF